MRRIRYGEMLENTVRNTFSSESRCSGVVTISLWKVCQMQQQKTMRKQLVKFASASSLDGVRESKTMIAGHTMMRRSATDPVKNGKSVR